MQWQGSWEEVGGVVDDIQIQVSFGRDVLEEHDPLGLLHCHLLLNLLPSFIWHLQEIKIVLITARYQILPDQEPPDQHCWCWDQQSSGGSVLTIVLILEMSEERWTDLDTRWRRKCLKLCFNNLIHSLVHCLNITGVRPETIMNWGEGDSLGPEIQRRQHHVRAVIGQN